MSTLLAFAGYPAHLIQEEIEREKLSDLKEPPAATANQRQMEHKLGCLGYYAAAECECQRPDWKPIGGGNYPYNPNPPLHERDPRDRD